MTNGKVLIVDDEESVVESYTMQLEDTYEVETATSGGECLMTIDETFDAVLLDRRMPEISGDEVLKQIRNDLLLDVNVIMVTAVEPDKQEVKELEFDDYLVKPVGRQQLIDAIETLRLLDEYNRTLQSCYSLIKRRQMLSSKNKELESKLDEERGQLFDIIEQFPDEIQELCTEIHVSPEQRPPT